MKAIVSAAVFLTGLASQATAADVVDRAPPDNPPLPAIEGPTFSFTGYFWASAINGRTSTLPPLPAVDLDESFTDIIKDLDGGIMGAGELRVGRWGFLTDLMFSQVSPGGDLPGPFFSSVEVRSRSLTLQGDVLYRVVEDPAVTFDVGAGLRYWSLNNKLTINPGALNLKIEHSEGEDWVDPVLAARTTLQISGPWSITLAGDIGGFDVGSKFTYQAVGLVNYQWNENWAFRAGYRVLSVDYKNDDFLYDVRMYGPIIAATYKF